jgi:hypothetical protein
LIDQDILTGEEFEFVVMEYVSSNSFEDISRPLNLTIAVMIGGKVDFSKKYLETERDRIIREVLRRYGDIIDEIGKKCRTILRRLRKFELRI